MYENQTYDEILQRLLGNVPDTMDKREGSFIWDVLSPIALELEEAYKQLDLILHLTFIQTTNGQYLDYRVEEHGIERKEATKATGHVTVTGSNGTVIPVGSIFSTGAGVQFQTTTEATIGETGVTTVDVEAVEAGTSGNVPAETITEMPVSIQGVTDVTNDSPTTGGSEEETDEELYERYLEEINATRYGGNVDQYEGWISDITGVGRFKIQPLWNGRGTVRAIITDANNQAPSQEIVDLVQNTLDPYQDGMGIGLVPIGHVFTAVGATPKVIDFDLTVVFEEGYGIADIQQDVYDIIDEYFSEINFISTTIRQAVLIGRLISLEPIKDITSLTINDVDGNITLEEEEVAKRGTVVINGN